MEDKLKSLTEKLYKEGVLEGSKKAEEIISTSKKDAEKIVKDAKTTAETILKEAKVKADNLLERAKGELELAYKQTTNQLKNQISEMLTLKQVELKDINVSLMKQEFIENAVLNILKNWDLSSSEGAGATLHFHKNSEASIAQFIKTNCSSYLNKGLEIKFDRTGSGFSIQPKDSSYEINFDDQALFNFFKSNLKPYTKNVLFN